MSHKLTRVYDQRAGGTLTAEGPTGVVQPLPAQVQVYWARLHLAEIIRCGGLPERPPAYGMAGVTETYVVLVAAD